jgi:hypothetical protein
LKRPGIASVTYLVTTALASALPAEAPVPAAVHFNRDVRPIMANTCFKCHGPDLKANKADLRLDLPENARMTRKDKAGRTLTPIVPGNLQASEVWRRVSSADQTQVMPPPASLHLLTARDKEVIRRWIEQGAVYEAHWAYTEPKKADPPGGGIAADNPIDRFVLMELEARGLKPSPEASRRTLIRRVSLDLTGLPPSPAEVESFVADTRPAPTSAWSSASSPRPITASGWRSPGSTSPGLPTPSDSTATSSTTIFPTATG